MKVKVVLSALAIALAGTSNAIACDNTRGVIKKILFFDDQAHMVIELQSRLLVLHPLAKGGHFVKVGESVLIDEKCVAWRVGNPPTTVAANRN